MVIEVDAGNRGLFNFQFCRHLYVSTKYSQLDYQAIYMSIGEAHLWQLGSYVLTAV
jgi:hypothetical protein